MRRANYRWLFLLALLPGLTLTGCNSTLDDAGGAHVVLEVETMTPAPVTGTDDGAGGCTFTVQEWSATLKNEPKNALAVNSPFNDIVLQDVLISYMWDDPGLVTPDRTVGIAGTIAAEGTGTVRFTPILFGDLSLANAGHSAVMTLTFRGRTVAGDGTSAVATSNLNVESCQ